MQSSSCTATKGLVYFLVYLTTIFNSIGYMDSNGNLTADFLARVEIEMVP